MTERSITAEQLKEEIAITERDLSQLRAQLRALDGRKPGDLEKRIIDVVENPTPVREISLKVGSSRESVGSTASRMVQRGLLTRVSPGVFQRVM